MIGIYKITSLTKKVYIGQSINIEKRFNTYKNLNCKTQIILYNSFLKYGVDKHKFEILCECDIIELNEKERYYQDVFSSMSINGMNCKLTKSSDRSGLISDETKLKIGKFHKGNKYRLGKKHSDETKFKIGEAGKKRKRSNDERSEEFKNKLKAANLKRFDETPEKSWWKYMPKEYFENMRKHFL